jgi:hypothetical protein
MPTKPERVFILVSSQNGSDVGEEKAVVAPVAAPVAPVVAPAVVLQAEEKDATAIQEVIFTHSHPSL